MMSLEVRKVLDKTMDNARREFNDIIAKIAQDLRDQGFRGEIKAGFNLIIDYGEEDRKNGQGVESGHIIKMPLPLDRRQTVWINDLMGTHAKEVLK